MIYNYYQKHFQHEMYLMKFSGTISSLTVDMPPHINNFCAYFFKIQHKVNKMKMNQF